MTESVQDLIKELLVQISQADSGRRISLLEEVIAVHGDRIGEGGIQKLRTLVPFVDHKNDLLPKDDAIDGQLRVGDYQLEGLIASGGMADVYRATEPPPLERQVAIKVMRRGLLSKTAFERFRFERDSLKTLDHPNIAAVFDAGDTEDGFPFLVMPYIEGHHITDFAKQAKLSVFERVKLMAQVCEGLSCAHQRGLVHRDLKPSNILVSTGKGSAPLAKIIDFGIARHAVPAEVGGTRSGGEPRIGTPDYMSPEQASGSAASIDQRSDLYSLGVVLFEVLTGTLPWTRARERATTLASGENSSRKVSSEILESALVTHLGASLSRSRLRELSWILDRCLREDQSERYPNGQSLADDLDAFLGTRAISVAPPGGLYRLSKWVRSHPATAVAVSLIFLSSIAISIVLANANRRTRTALRQVREAQAETELALAENKIFLADTEATTNFLIRMIEDASPEFSETERTVSDMLDTALDRINQDALSSSSASWRVRIMLAGTLRLRGNLPESFEQANRALEEILEMHGPGSPAHGQALTTRSETLYEMGQVEEALGGYSEAVQIFTTIGDEECLTDRLRTQEMIAEAESALGHRDRAAEILRRTVNEWQAHAPSTEAAYTAELRLVDELIGSGELEKALVRIEDIESSNEISEVLRMAALYSRFEIEQTRGDLEGAYSSGREYLTWCEKHYGKRGLRTLQSRVLLARIDTVQRDLDERIADLREAHELIAERLGNRHPLLIHAKFSLGETLRKAGELTEAVQWLLRSRELILELFGDEHPNRILIEIELSRTMIATGREAELDEMGISPRAMEAARDLQQSPR